MTQPPFEILRWDDKAQPSLDQLQRLLEREGLQPQQTELAAQSHSPETKFQQVAVKVLVAGKVQYSFPGYGVIELEPGDVLEINPGVLHDVIVASTQPAVLPEAIRPG